MLTAEEIKELANKDFTVAAVVDEFDAIASRLRDIMKDSENDIARLHAQFSLGWLEKALGFAVDAHAEHLEL